MKLTGFANLTLCAMMVAGCVSAGLHRETISELEATKQAYAKLKQQAESERVRAEELQTQLTQSMEEHDQVARLGSELRRERDLLQERVGELDNHSRDLASRLEAEKAQVAMLQEDKQRLMTGTTTAQEEIARMQKRLGELETEAVRAKDLDARLTERTQEIAQMRQHIGELQAVASRVPDLESRLSKRDRELGELRIAKADLDTRVTDQANEIQRLQQAVADREELARQVSSLTDERSQLQSTLYEQRDRLKVEEAEKARLERERAEKEAEIRRLTQTHKDLTKSLEAEIQKGDIRIQQVRDRLTINMVDRVLFDSGQGHVKPAGLKVLKQVSDILQKVEDKQIRIEGHTDNVPIGAKLRDRFPTNWELSTARATSVVRYIIEEGGVSAETISAVGYADTRPVSTNETEEGRSSNRRIEIVLYPKDLSQIARQFQ